MWYVRPVPLQNSHAVPGEPWNPRPRHMPHFTCAAAHHLHGTPSSQTQSLSFTLHLLGVAGTTGGRRRADPETPDMREFPASLHLRNSTVGLLRA